MWCIIKNKVSRWGRLDLKISIERSRSRCLDVVSSHRDVLVRREPEKFVIQFVPQVQVVNFRLEKSRKISEKESFCFFYLFVLLWDMCVLLAFEETSHLFVGQKFFSFSERMVLLWQGRWQLILKAQAQNCLQTNNNRRLR